MPWYTSWIPGLPTINFPVPTTIQGRFISFVLKKSLGHLLKPGQLDHNQIDSQIGSGYVQINDLELHPEGQPINAYLEGLPLSLQDGTISSVKARIPWPNPLASTLGFSMKSLHLVFQIVPVSESSRKPEVDIADSVASVAESFLHEELSPKEEAILWQSIHQEDLPPTDVNDNQAIPGGLETLSIGGYDTHKLDSDPAGVSVFAGLIERLLARFEFDVQDIKITLIHPDNMRLTLSLDEIRYHTTSKSTSSTHPSSESMDGECRILSLSGLSLYAKGLVSSTDGSFAIGSPAQGGSFSTTTSRPASRASSQSSVDEDAQFAMSQSLANLPSRPDSPASSVSESMYESAISTAPRPPLAQDSLVNTPIPETPIQPCQPPEQARGVNEPPVNVNEPLLSFGPHPISITLATPSPVSTPDDDPFSPSSGPSPASVTDELQITVSTDVIAAAFRPWHIQGLLGLVRAMTPRDIPPPEPSKTPKPNSFPPFRVTAQFRGILLLLLSGSSEMPDDGSILSFFQRPLVPPPLYPGYTRIHVDSLFASLSSSLRVPSRSNKTTSRNPKSSTSHTSLDFRISDISIFSFIQDPKSTDLSDLIAFPILVSDPYLGSQYSDRHVQPHSGTTYPTLPSFTVTDWTERKDYHLWTRLSYWRCRPSPGAEPPSHTFLRVLGHRSVTPTSDKKGDTATSDSLEVHINPLQIRADLDLVLQPGGPLAFLEELLSLEPYSSDRDSVASDITVDEHSSSSRKGMSYDDSPFGDPSSFALPTTSRKVQHQAEEQEGHQSSIIIKFPIVRVSLSCPPPPQYNRRSGIFVVDLHDIDVDLGSPPNPTRRHLRFSTEKPSPDPEADISEESVVMRAGFRRAVVGCALVGSTSVVVFASVGPLVDEELAELESPDPSPAPLQPRIRLIEPPTGTLNAPSIMALSVDIPSVHVDISKTQFDALQYWTDDISQLLEHLSGKAAEETERIDSRDTSLIGSRFFAKSRAGSGLSSSARKSAESVVKLTMTEIFISVGVPRLDGAEGESRPFQIQASDLDILLELNPDNEQQTVVTVGVMDISVKNAPQQGPPQMFLNLTSAPSLSTVPKSILKLRFSTSIISESNTKETRIKLTLCGFTYRFFPDTTWISDLASFAKSPPGTFESVIPSDRTRVSVKILDGSVCVFAPKHCGALVLYLQELEFSTDVVGGSRDSSFQVIAPGLSLLASDDVGHRESVADPSRSLRGITIWTSAGYALLSEVSNLDLNVTIQLDAMPFWKADLNTIVFHLHLCADTLTSVSAFIQDLGTMSKNPDEGLKIPEKGPAIVSQPSMQGRSIMSSVEDLRFTRPPEIGAAPDMIYDDLPTNPDYLDESFGAAAGLREILDEDLDDFDDRDIRYPTGDNDPSTISNIGGETIKVFDSQGLEIIEDYFLTIPPDTATRPSDLGESRTSIRILNGSFNLFLYDGYDWANTRKTIEEEVKEMRKRLARIRQLVANGHMQEDPSSELTSAILFNSIHIGLEEDEDALGEPATLIAAIDRELKDDVETASWQSFPTFTPGKPRVPSMRVHGKRLTRAKASSMEFCLAGICAEFDQYQPNDPLVSRTFVTVRDLEILDHIKTSTWKKFLTELRSDSHGNIRETDSNMVRIELRGVRPVPGHSSEEARLKAKILPLRLYVDQDAVDFLKKFFSFKDPHAAPSPEPQSDEGEAYIQLAEIFPIDLKLDYKPRRVDYRALKEGRTIELMNFFHFDGAEMTLRHITLAGVTGWGKMFEMLNDLWTPDVKATQLVEVISGVAPIRSMVNVGSGVADLVLLPIAQYKKDGRIVRGVQKGATAFVKSTAIEAVKMGAKLATGTQVILEQAEGILGGQFNASITTETVQVLSGDDVTFENEAEDDGADLISRYAQQPVDIREGMQSAYKSLQRNLSSAAQTILAVPMEVYERSGNEGAVRSVIRAVPIAVLKPMIGASEAASKALQGLHNTLDPNVRHENEAKYKLR